MEIEILYFGPLAELLGRREERFPLRSAECVADVLARLTETEPELGARLDHVAVAVNEEYVGRNHPLDGGDTLALIPPVSGG